MCRAPQLVHGGPHVDWPFKKDGAPPFQMDGGPSKERKAHRTPLPVHKLSRARGGGLLDCREVVIPDDVAATPVAVSAQDAFGTQVRRRCDAVVEVDPWTPPLRSPRCSLRSPRCSLPRTPSDFLVQKELLQLVRGMASSVLNLSISKTLDQGSEITSY